MIHTTPNLKGLRVLVTRPEHQAEPFCQMIESAGGRAVRFPVLEIADVEDIRPVEALIKRLRQFDYAFFISPNAAERGIGIIRARQTSLAGLRLAAIGKKTAATLKRLRFPATLVPDSGFSSEDLLALPELQSLTGMQAVIFRGEGGRDLLATTLQARGARVEYANVYRRIRPEPSAARMEMLKNAMPVGIIAITSVEAFNNLVAMTGKIVGPQLFNTPLVVGSRRIADASRALGFQHAPLIADNPGDDAMLSALFRWAQQSH